MEIKGTRSELLSVIERMGHFASKDPMRPVLQHIVVEHVTVDNRPRARFVAANGFCIAFDDLPCQTTTDVGARWFVLPASLVAHLKTLPSGGGEHILSIEQMCRSAHDAASAFTYPDVDGVRKMTIDNKPTRIVSVSVVDLRAALGALDKLNDADIVGLQFTPGDKSLSLRTLSTKGNLLARMTLRARDEGTNGVTEYAGEAAMTGTLRSAVNRAYLLACVSKIVGGEVFLHLPAWGKLADYRALRVTIGAFDAIIMCMHTEDAFFEDHV